MERESDHHAAALDREQSASSRRVRRCELALEALELGGKRAARAGKLEEADCL